MTVAKSAIALTIPRLADFSHARKSSLVSPVVLGGLFRTFEAACVVVLGFVIALAYVDEPTIMWGAAYWLAHGTTAAAVVLAFELLGLYRMQALAAPLSQLPRSAAGVAIAFTGLFAVLFFLKISDDFSRVWLAVWFSASIVALATGRLVMGLTMSRLARQGRLYRRAAVYGSGAVAKAVIAQLEADPSTDIRICGIFDDRLGRTPSMIEGYPYLGGRTDLVEFARTTRLDLTIIALPLAAQERLAEVTQTLSVLPIEVKVPALSTTLRFAPGTYSHVGSVAMIDLHKKPITDWGTVSKWLFDKIISITAIVLLAPVLLGIAAAVRLDSRGPALFRQKRYGFNNESIVVYKFRSMYAEQADASASRLVSKNDDRVTPVGRFIRTTSLDELPQLFNVLLGTLSLVGPRPHATEAKAAGRLYNDVVDGYFARHKVKPGITGWAQINGWRGETDTDEKIRQRVAHDLYYIENWSVFLDAYILVMTPVALLTQRDHAY